jgi:hypothetical protein
MATQIASGFQERVGSRFTLPSQIGLEGFSYHSRLTDLAFADEHAEPTIEGIREF